LANTCTTATAPTAYTLDRGKGSSTNTATQTSRVPLAMLSNGRYARIAKHAAMAVWTDLDWPGIVSNMGEANSAATVLDLYV